MDLLSTGLTMYRLAINTTSTSCRSLWLARCCEATGNSIPGMNLTYPNAREQKKERKQRFGRDAGANTIPTSFFFLPCGIWIGELHLQNRGLNGLLGTGMDAKCPINLNFAFSCPINPNSYPINLHPN